MQRTLGHGEDGTLLNGGWLLETIGVDAAEELVLEVEIIEALDDGVPVRLRRMACACVTRDTIGMRTDTCSPQ